MCGSDNLDNFMCRLFRNSGDLNLLETSGPVQTYIRIALHLLSTKQSNIDIIQRFQNKVLRNIVIAPWYIRSNDIDRDLQVDVVSSEIQRFAQKH